MNNKSTSHLCFNSFLHPSHSLFTFKLFSSYFALFLLIISVFKRDFSFSVSFSYYSKLFSCSYTMFLVYLSFTLSLSFPFSLTLSLTLFNSNCLSYSSSFQQYLLRKSLFLFLINICFLVGFHIGPFKFIQLSSRHGYKFSFIGYFFLSFCLSTLSPTFLSFLFNSWMMEHFKNFFFQFFFESIFFSF